MVHVCLEDDKNLCVRTVFLCEFYSVTNCGCLNESDDIYDADAMKSEMCIEFYAKILDLIFLCSCGRVWDS